MEVLVLEYGFIVVLAAFLTITLVGLIKVAFKKQLERIEKSNRKVVYEVVSMVIVTVVAVILTSTPLGSEPKDYIATIIASYGAMKVMYPLYENFKIRDLVQLLGKLIKEKTETKEVE